MRVGIFSDVHANWEALSAVLGGLEQVGVDRYVCLGDVVGYGADPNLCCDRIRELTMVTILGNHDAAASGRIDYSDYYDAARHVLTWHASILSAENLKWLSELPYESRVEHMTFCHGSPIAVEEFAYLFAPEQAADCLAKWKELNDITFIGHSHLCKAFALAENDVYEVVADSFVLRPGYKYIVSVGSVGQPRDHDNRSSFTVYDSEKRQFEFHRVGYDIETAAKKISAAKLEPSFADRLFLGI